MCLETFGPLETEEPANSVVHEQRLRTTVTAKVCIFAPEMQFQISVGQQYAYF